MKIYDLRSRELEPEHAISIETDTPTYAKDLANAGLRELGLPEYKWRAITDARGLPADRMTVRFVKVWL